MKPTRKMSRRSFMSTVVGGAVAGAAALTISSEAAVAQQTGVTNNDPGDPVNGGRTGYTNNDPYDRPGYAPVRQRRYSSCGGRTGRPNSDPGDPGGNGRTGITNGDPGDRAGYGC